MSRLSRLSGRFLMGMVLTLIFCTSFVFAKTNVIIMVVDGGGYGAYRISSQYRTGEDRGLPFMKPDSGWSEFGCTTYSLSGVVQNTKVVDGEVQQITSYSEDGSYDPATHWVSFKKHLENPTDSAAATTAINTGVKTKNGRINYDRNDQKLETIAEYVTKKGFAAGAITTVMPSHATPAGVAGHNMKRGSGKDLWREMVKKTDVLSVIMGACHPWYTENAERREKPKFIEYGPSEHAWGEIWSQELYYGWKYIEDREDFQKIASGEAAPPKKLMGLPKVTSTFQSSRTKSERNETVPTLTECTLAGLNVLDQNEKGFYLLVESGSVDWLAHGNVNPQKIIDEMNEFYDAVEAVCAWVEKNSSWEETTLILTADHETGSIWGPDADKEGTLFQTPIGKGKGNIPEIGYFSRSHTNAPVPFYVYGAGAPLFEKRVRCTDDAFGKMWGFSGRIIDNTDIVPVEKELFDRK